MTQQRRFSVPWKCVWSQFSAYSPLTAALFALQVSRQRLCCARQHRELLTPPATRPKNTLFYRLMSPVSPLSAHNPRLGGHNSLTSHSHPGFSSPGVHPDSLTREYLESFPALFGFCKVLFHRNERLHISKGWHTWRKKPKCRSESKVESPVSSLWSCRSWHRVARVHVHSHTHTHTMC